MVKWEKHSFGFIDVGFNPSSTMGLISAGLTFHACRKDTVDTHLDYHRNVMSTKSTSCK